MLLTRRQVAGALLAAPLLASRSYAAETWPKMPDPQLWRIDVPPQHEGTAEGGPNGQVYYRIYGEEPGRTPIVALHGGPAAGHTYMRPYSALATDRQVVLYDQSGCGRSARPADLSLYTIDRYVGELEALRSHLGLERMIVLGHSWGSVLAPAYAASYPDRVEAIVLTGSVTRYRDYQEGHRSSCGKIRQHRRSRISENLGRILPRPRHPTENLAPVGIGHFRRLGR